MDNSEPYNQQADIWSLGITAIELAEKNPPLVDLQPMRALCVIPFEPPPVLKDANRWSTQFHDFVDCCLRKDPKVSTCHVFCNVKSCPNRQKKKQQKKERKTSTQLLSHAWILSTREVNLQRLIELHRQTKLGEQATNEEISRNWADFLENSHVAPENLKPDPSVTELSTTVKVTGFVLETKKKKSIF